jgi:hypothetical protein
MTVPYVLAYAPLAYRKAYDESFLRSVLKIGLVLATYTIIVGAGLVAIAIWQR